MSIVVPDQKKPWVLLAGAIGLVVAVGTTIALVDLPGEQLLSRGDGARRRAAAVAQVPQATWDMNIRASATEGELSPAQEKVLDRQRPELRALVRRVYDSLFIHPNRLPETLKENFSEPAAIALRRSGAGAGEVARVSTTLRRARIGIQAAGGARMAVAAVTVRALGEGAGRPVVHRSSLWLERARGDWKVVAFDVRQAPLSEGSETKKRKSKGAGG